MIEVFTEQDDFCCGLWRNLFISDFRTTASVESLYAVMKWQAEACKRNPSGIATLSMVGPGPLPNAEVRKVSEEVNQLNQTGVLSVALVVEVTGFVGSALRGIITGLNMVKKTPYPIKVFDTTDKAVPWTRDAIRADASWERGATAAIRDMKARRPAKT
jgi:hypothetical protein